MNEETKNNKAVSIINKIKDKIFTFSFLKIVFIGVLGLVLIYVIMSLDNSSFINNDDVINIDTNVNNDTSDKYLKTIEYAKYLENKIVSLYSNMGSIGKVTAMVSLSGSSTFNYQTSGSISGDNDNIIFVESGNEKYPLVVSEVLPKVSSVTIVCKGLTDAMRVDIIRSVSTMFELSTDKVYVLKG